MGVLVYWFWVFVISVLFGVLFLGVLKVSEVLGICFDYVRVFGFYIVVLENFKDVFIFRSFLFRYRILFNKSYWKR